MKPLRIIGSLLIFLSPVLSPAQSQMSVPYQAPDLSGYATTASVNAAISTATPAPCPVPLADTLIGSVGSQPICMTRADATRPTVIQAVTVITNSDGSFSGTWPAVFAAAPTFRSATVDISSSQNAPIDCSFIAGSVTATGFAGKCSQLTATTLPTVTTALLGLVVSPVINAAGGQTVRIVGRQ